MQNKFRLAVLASGTGTNFQQIFRSIKNGILDAEIAGLITNNPKSGARQFADDNGIPVEVINAKRYPDEGGVTAQILETLENWNQDLIVLAGYMKKLSDAVVKKYKHRIINIHPALLPSFGGQGMYGIHVHEAAIEYGVRFSGVTVHLVDADYDTGPIILQEVVPVLQDDEPKDLQERILEQEYKIYTEAIKLFVEDRITVSGRRVIIRENDA